MVNMHAFLALNLELGSKIIEISGSKLHNMPDVYLLLQTP